MRYACIVALVAIAGCATPTYTPPTSYAIEPAIDVPAAAQRSALSVGVRPLESARPYRQYIAFRDQGMVLGAYENHEWAELPRDVVTRALIDALAATNRFQDTGLAAVMSRPDLILTGQLRRFDEVRTTDPWTAEIEVSLTLREALKPEVVWSDTLSAREPLARNEVSAMPEAMSRAVAAVVNQAATAIAAR